MPDKLLTVIVPSYNMEEYLSKCLGSLIVPDEAMLQRLDVIVVNDGSTDRTSEIAHRFEKDYAGVFRVIDKTNGNYGSCINAALPLAAGTYVKILDADDTFDTTAFERYLRHLDEHGGENAPDVFFNDFAEVDSSGTTVKKHDYAFVDEPGFSFDRFDYHDGRSLWMHAIAYRTNLLQSIGYRQTEGISYTDQEWVCLPMLHVRSFKHCPEAIYRYLVGRPGQTCDESVRLKNFAMHFRVAKSIIRSYEKGKGTLPEANLTFAENQIHEHLRFFYHTCLLSFPRQTGQEELAVFDEFLRSEAPDMHEFAGSFKTLFFRRAKPFHFVREWRKKATRRTPAFLLCDLATACRRAKQRLSQGTHRQSGLLH